MAKELIMANLCQLYNNQGIALAGKGGIKEDIFSKGLLHGASHVWVWRKNNDVVEILLQKRSSKKLTWPNKYDVSAAGHIDLDETPLAAAIREAKEEINLDVQEDKLESFGVYRAYMVAENGAIENEFQWLYIFEVNQSAEFNLEKAEVDSLKWMPVDNFEKKFNSSEFVPHGRVYYETVLSAVKFLSGQ